MTEPKLRDPARTWDEVAAEYTRRNPHDPMGHAMVWKVGARALERLREKLAEYASERERDE